MSIRFRLGKYVNPSGFGLAMVDVPDIDPEKNISLIDKSYIWPENVANVDSAVIKTYVDQGGHMPQMTVTDFVVTNVTTTATNDVDVAPLYYRHVCRFHHYSYGENPTKHVYITDQNGNILKGINYLVRASRVSRNIYKIDVLTDFQTNEYVAYKVKYNRCLIDGSAIHPSWTEILNAEELFKAGSPLLYTYEYSLSGPDSNGLYTCIVPPVPVVSELVNSVGMSFENAPTSVIEDPTNTSAYVATVRYTLKASGTTTFTIQRNKNRATGASSTDYLTSATSDSWGTATNFNIGTTITGIPGLTLIVNSDNYLKTNDETYFTAGRAYYYLKPVAYNAIYLKKPKNVTPEDDWYIKVRDGKFRRRMGTDGNLVPSGQGTLWEYGVPEYDTQMFDFTYGPPYKESINERTEVIGTQTVQLQHTPVYILPSDVLYDSDYPGFPPSSYITFSVNDERVSQNAILDWDVYNGKVKLAQILSQRDDVIATYNYKEEFYGYYGFTGSGGIYPTGTPLQFLELDLNPTPPHNYGMYASGSIAHIYLKPHLNVDTSTVCYNECLYHNFTGTPSGVLDFELGSISLGPSCRSDDITLTDVRTRGGGLNKRGIKKLEDVMDVQPESEFFWDVGYFDGKAFPSNGVLVINIPNSVLKTNGGDFTEDEVRETIMKHMALGELPLINFRNSLDTYSSVSIVYVDPNTQYA